MKGLLSRKTAVDRGLKTLTQTGLEGQAPSMSQNASPKWRPVSILDEYAMAVLLNDLDANVGDWIKAWVAREARPISLRQLMVFGRSLSEARLISSANYVRTELPTRISHRIRDMQLLPFSVVENHHISEVYDLYYTAFDRFRKVKEIKTLDDNDRLCEVIGEMLRAHLTVIPKLARGVLECSELMTVEALDKFMNTILRSRISRRVIAEQHLSLTKTFHEPWFSPGAKLSDSDFIGEVFLRCMARDVVERCGRTSRDIARHAYGSDVTLPDIVMTGDLDASFPFILSHLEYIIGELLRNAVQAVAERHLKFAQEARAGSLERPPPPPPIEVTICESQQHVTIRVSDRGGGVPRDVMPYLWSFSKGPGAREHNLANLGRVPKMAATIQELEISTSDEPSEGAFSGSLGPLSRRPPNLRLGMGLPLSRVYAEYWAGSLTLHNLYGYGVDAFLQLSKLGNKNEQLATRASMDAI